MKTENKRIFISDLPETFTKDELENRFSQYGHIASIEIKERKELGPNNKSLFFAYVNLNTDDQNLNQCFRDLSNTKWNGQLVQLQIARESFLERLKRERQVQQEKSESNEVHHELKVEPVVNTDDNKINPSKSKKPKLQLKKDKSSSESETDSDSGAHLKINKSNTLLVNGISKRRTSQETEEKLDIVIKSNKNKVTNAGILKIPSVGKAPIIEISKVKSKQNDSEANRRRLQSLRGMKKEYAAQKSLIKNALTYGANKQNNKIIFDDMNIDNDVPNKNIMQNGIKKASLFHEEDLEEESDFEGNFEVKEQFQGKSGQKLLELQSKFKNDKRFMLDKRFLETENDDEIAVETEDNFETEKNEQIKILEEVLGKKVISKASNNKHIETRKPMVKFDPSQPGHSSLQLTVPKPERKKKIKEKNKEEIEDVKEQIPEVSKEVFYKVPEKLKESLTENTQFSLLSMFGKRGEDEEKDEETEKLIKPGGSLLGNQNPFKYESSDDEDEIEDIPHKDSLRKESDTKIADNVQARSSQSVFWTEPFFFKNDDFRLQEGLEFIEKISSESKEFAKIRRELKGIVKAKVRNNERKHKMFKKKLGGSKRRKQIRIKKALKQ